MNLLRCWRGQAHSARPLAIPPLRSARWPDWPPSVEIENCDHVDDALRPVIVLSSARMYSPRMTGK
jgi:hypothetical protein